MLFSSSLSFGALAVAAANAFLVPLNSDNLITNDLSINQGPQTINLDCTSCPYALKSERNGQHEWTNDVASNLELNFQVVDNVITFNGVPVFPVARPGSPPVLTVKQKVKEGVETSFEGLDRELRLSYSLSAAQKPFDDGNSLIILEVTPMALDGQMIRVDDLEVKAIKDSAGTVTLHTVNTVTPPPNAPDAQCTNVMCRVMSKLLSGIASVKSATKTAAHKIKCLCVKCFHCVLRMMGHKAHHHHHHHHNNKGQQENSPAAAPQPIPVGTIELPTHHHFQTVDGRPHPHHHQAWQHKSFFGRMAHIAWVTVKIAFIPILIGIAFGMAASAIGMLVGQAVVLLWIRYRRHDAAPAYEELPTDEKEDGEEEEVPPPYEDLPAAVQAAIIEKDVENKA